MPIFPTSIIPAAAATSADPVVERGLRFEDGDSARLTRTPGNAGNQKTWTFSCWAKRGNLTYTRGAIFAAGAFGVGDWMELDFDSSDQLEVYFKNASYHLVTTQKFRDTSAWYHIVLAVDTTQTTDSNKVKIWVNGTQVTAFITSTYPSVDDEDLPEVNSTSTHHIGYSGSSEYFDGSLADIYLLDGTAKVASDFAEENSNGQWVPKATSFSGSDYGTNGFHIDFVGGHDSELLLQSDHPDGSTNFEDSSGAGHYGISVTGDTQHSIKVGTPFTGDDRSIYFDGSGDYLDDQDSASTDWNLGTDEFCFETWYRSPGGSPSEGYIFVTPHGSSSMQYVNLRIESGGNVKSVVAWSGDYNGDQTASVNMHDGKWHHIALVRDNSGTDALYIYVDGKRESTVTAGANYGGSIGSFTFDDGNEFTIGANNDGGGYLLTGHLYDFRMTLGDPVYTGEFTPPSGKLTTTGGTYPSTTNVNTSIATDKVVMLIQPHKDDTDWHDESTSDHTITGYGDLSSSSYSAPTASTPYDGVGERSAIQFDGSGDYLSVPSSSKLNLTDNDFTVEFWANFVGTGQQTLVSWGNGYQFGYQPSGSGGKGWYLYQASDGFKINETNAGAVPSGWTHVALVDNGTNLKVYVDGSEATSASSFSSLSGTMNFGRWHGTGANADNYFNGYMFDVRITNGTARDVTASDYRDNPFESTAVIHPGGDSSSKRNHFDVVNIGMGDVVRDCPESGANFATINPLNSSNITHSEGNLKTAGSDNIQCEASIYIPDTGSAATSKFYWEVKHTGSYPTTGYRDASSAMPSIGDIGYEDSVTQGWSSGGTAYSGGGTSVSLDETFSTGDIIMFAVDVNAGKSWLGLNGTWVNSGNPATGANETMTFSFDSIAPYASHSTTYPSESTIYNFGQDGSFAGNHTGTLVTGGGGEWAYAPPTGFKALKTGNLSTTSATTFSYTGNGSDDGPFVYMGYRPSSVTIDTTDTYYDGSYNPNDNIDWLANGIKIRDASQKNGSGTSYDITAAPKEKDFKYGTAR